MIKSSCSQRQYGKWITAKDVQNLNLAVFFIRKSWSKAHRVCAAILFVLEMRTPSGWTAFILRLTPPPDTVTPFESCDFNP